MLLPYRPHVRLRIYPEVYPGQTFDATVLLDALRPVTVEHVDITFFGTELRLFSNKLEHARRLSLVHLSARAAGPKHLRPGITELGFKVPLPPGIPPSYEGRSVRTRYELLVHVAVPWWLDRHERFVVKVTSSEQEHQMEEEIAPATVPGRFSSSTGGPRGTEPHMEGSLATTNILPGSVLSGAVALSNIAHNRYRALYVSLVSHERDPRDPEPTTVEVKRYELELPLESLREGQPIPFHLAVPCGLHPTHRSKLWELCWALEVRADMAWRPDLKFLVPVKVLPERATNSAAGPQIRVPPSIGSPRIEAIWREVAGSTGLTFSEEGLRGVFPGETRVEVRRERLGRRGNFLVGELRYPTLGIGLRVRSLRGLERHWGAPSLSFGDPAWDRKNQIEGRDVAQVLAFGRQVVGALWAFTGVDLDDDRARVERKGTGHDRRVLEQFVTNVQQLAEAVLRGRETVPAPAEMERALPEWEALAQRMHGTLIRANMSVEGTFHGLSAHVATDWSANGAPRYTRVELQPARPLAKKYTLSLTPGEQQQPEDCPEEARELLRLIIDGAEAFNLGPERLILMLPAPLIEPVPFVTDRLEWMVQLSLALGHSGGPYR